MGIKVNIQKGFLNRRQIENFKAASVCLQYNTNMDAFHMEMNFIA